MEIGLTYIYGIGRVSSNKILAAADVNPDTRVKDLTDEEVTEFIDVIDGEYTVEGDLRREVAMVPNFRFQCLRRVMNEFGEDEWLPAGSTYPTHFSLIVSFTARILETVSL